MIDDFEKKYLNIGVSQPQNGRGYGKGLDVRRPPKPTGGDDYAETPPPRGYSLQPPIPRGYASDIESSIDPTIQTPGKIEVKL